MNLKIPCLVFGHKPTARTEEDHSMEGQILELSAGRKLIYGAGRATSYWCSHCGKQTGWDGKRWD